MGNPILALATGMPPASAPSARHSLLVPAADERKHNPASSGGWTVDESVVFNNTAPTDWTDLDLSATVTGPAFVRLGFDPGASSPMVRVRPNGDTDFTSANPPRGGVDRMEPWYHGTPTYNFTAILDCFVGADGIVEWMSSEAVAMEVLLVGYAPCTLGTDTQTFVSPAIGAWNTVTFTDTTNDGLALIKVKPTTVTGSCTIALRAFGDTTDYVSFDDSGGGYNLGNFSNAANIALLLEVPMIAGKIEFKVGAAGDTFEVSLAAYIDTTLGWTTLNTVHEELSSTAVTWMEDMSIANAISVAGMAVLKLENCASRDLAVRRCGFADNTFKAYNLTGIGGGCQVQDPDANGNGMFSCNVTAGGTIDFISQDTEADFDIRCLGYVALAAS